MENVTLRTATNYELTPEGTVINKKTGKPMTETNGTVTLSVDGKRKRFKVAELIEANQPKKKAKKKYVKNLKGFEIENTWNGDGYVVTTENEKFFKTKAEHTVGYRHCGNHSTVASARLTIANIIAETEVNEEEPKKSKKEIIRMAKYVVKNADFARETGYNTAKDLMTDHADEDIQMMYEDVVRDEQNNPEPKKTKTERKVGDERTRKDGRVMVWSKTPTGFDWRRKIDHRRKENK